MKEQNCLRCGHIWYQRKPTRPRRCPRCTQPYWDKPVGYRLPPEKMRVKAVKKECLRCGKKWMTWLPGQPITCPNPKCKSAYWDRLPGQTTFIPEMEEKVGG